MKSAIDLVRLRCRLVYPKLYARLIMIVRHTIIFDMFRLQMTVLTVFIRTFIGMLALNVTIFMQRY